MKHQVKIVIGANYGDEGKGLMSRYFVRQLQKSGRNPITVLYNGSAQRGHTVDYEDGSRHIYHNFGAGTREGSPTYYAPAFMVHPMDFCREVDELGYIPFVYCSPNCEIVTPIDMLADQIIVDYNEAKNGKREYSSCCYGTWSATDRKRSRTGFRAIMTVGSYTDRQYWEWMRAALKWFDYRLESHGVRKEDVPRWSDYIQHKQAMSGVLYHFKADMDRFMGLVRIMAFSEVMRDFPNVVFEGGQGLMLSSMADKIYHTTSNPGISTPRTMLEVYRQCDIEACYVTRTYLTRHGDGPLEGEVDKANLGLLSIDKTNVWNPFQGSLRYAPLDVDALKSRIHDLDMWHWLSGDKQYRKTIALTHCNELDLPYFGERYRSYSPCEVKEVQ